MLAHLRREAACAVIEVPLLYHVFTPVLIFFLFLACPKHCWVYITTLMKLLNER